MPYKDKETKNTHERFRVAINKLRHIEEAGGQCVDCGYDDVPEILQFHHRDGSEKNIDTTGRYGEETVKREIALCDLICPTCHTLRHVIEEEWKGQTIRRISYPKGVKSTYSITRLGRSDTLSTNST
jgi:hypothetical protein